MQIFNSVRDSLALSVVVALGAAGSVTAQPGRLDGGGTVFNFSQPCIDGGWSGSPEAFSVRYHPPGVGNNGPHESISFIHNGHAVGFALYDGSFSSAYQNVDHGMMFSRPWFVAADSPDAAELRVIAMYPAVVTEATTSPVRIRGQIRHFAGIRWCRVNFDVIVQTRP